MGRLSERKGLVVEKIVGKNSLQEKVLNFMKRVPGKERPQAGSWMPVLCLLGCCGWSSRHTWCELGFTPKGAAGSHVVRGWTPH